MEKQIGSQNIDEDLEGPIHEVMENISKLQMRASLKGWKDIKVVHEGDYDSCWFELWGTRMETNAEMKRRFASVRRRRENAAERAALEQFKEERARKLKGG